MTSSQRPAPAAEAFKSVPAGDGAASAVERRRLGYCPLCEAPLAEGRYRRLARYSREHLIQCKACGLRFAALEPTRQDYDRVYGNYEYEPLEAAQTEASRAKNDAIVDRLARFRKTNKVLDIAAGYGRFLEHFQQRGFECYCTEYDEEKRIALAKKGFHVLPGGTLPEGLDGQLDVIVFTEIIEHINNPRPVLANCARMLRPGGALYITTPNFASLERIVLKENWGMFCFPEHIVHWAPRQLDRALRDAGLVKHGLRTENISPLRILEGLKRGRLGSRLGNLSEAEASDAAQRAVAGSHLLTAAKKGLNGLLNLTRAGSSLIAIYVKPGPDAGRTEP